MNEKKELVAVNNLNSASINEFLQTQNSISPVVDIYETDDDFILTANMPGVARNNIQVKLENNSMIIFGKINFEEAVNRKYALNESEIGNYFRTFKLSDPIEKEQISARYDNGQLVVTLPKQEKAKPKTVEID